MEHSRIGFSSAYRWMKCPGSVRMSAGIERKSSPYADEGTAAHMLAELCLESKMLPEQYIGGKEFEIGGVKWPVTEDMALAVKIYTDYICAQSGPKKKIEVEKKVGCPQLHPQLWGTADCVIYESRKTLEIVDYKHGQGVVVDVKGNVQLMGYALSALTSFTDIDFSSVKMTVVQPRAPHPEGPIRSAEITPSKLLDWGYQSLGPAAKATDDPNAPIIAGPHCVFCPALDNCRAMANAATAMFDPAPQAKDLTPEQLAHVVNMESAIKSFIDACRNRVHEMLLRRESVPGCKLVFGRAGNRKWTDPAQAESAFRFLIGDSAFETKLKSPAQMEKITEKDIVRRYAVQGERKLKVAPDSDPAPAAEIPEFENVA